MVPFAGYELPVLYKGENGGVMKEHLWCREEGKAAMFDVSHMGQVRGEKKQPCEKYAWRCTEIRYLWYCLRS